MTEWSGMFERLPEMTGNGCEIVTKLVEKCELVVRYRSVRKWSEMAVRWTGNRDGRADAAMSDSCSDDAHMRICGG